MRVKELTAEQRALIPSFIDNWIAIGLSTKPVDHQRTEDALHRLYAAAGLLEPAIVWAPCP